MLKHQQKKLPRQGAVKVYRDGREVCLENQAGLREYKSRTRVMWMRQQGSCAICEEYMQRPTFDHERSRGGGHRDDRIWNDDGTSKNAALCEPCNRLKGSKRYKWVNGVYKPVEKFKEKAA